MARLVYRVPYRPGQKVTVVAPPKAAGKEVEVPVAPPVPVEPMVEAKPVEVVVDKPIEKPAAPAKKVSFFDKDFLPDELDQEIAVIRGEIWDNCRDWCYKCEI